MDAHTQKLPEVEIRALSEDELDNVTGAFWAAVGASLVAAVAYEMITGSGKQTIPEFLGHLK
jgi:hypothetical protein